MPIMIIRLVLPQGFRHMRYDEALFKFCKTENLAAALKKWGVPPL